MWTRYAVLTVPPVYLAVLVFSAKFTFLLHATLDIANSIVPCLNVQLKETINILSHWSGIFAIPNNGKLNSFLFLKNVRTTKMNWSHCIHGRYLRHLIHLTFFYGRGVDFSTGIPLSRQRCTRKTSNLLKKKKITLQKMLTSHSSVNFDETHDYVDGWWVCMQYVCTYERTAIIKISIGLSVNHWDWNAI